MNIDPFAEVNYIEISLIMLALEIVPMISLILCFRVRLSELRCNDATIDEDSGLSNVKKSLFVDTETASSRLIYGFNGNQSYNVSRSSTIVSYSSLPTENINNLVVSIK